MKETKKAEDERGELSEKLLQAQARFEESSSKETEAKKRREDLNAQIQALIKQRDEVSHVLGNQQIATEKANREYGEIERQKQSADLKVDNLNAKLEAHLNKLSEDREQSDFEDNPYS